jgi:hypothetical protein
LSRKKEEEAIQRARRLTGKISEAKGKWSKKLESKVYSNFDRWELELDKPTKPRKTGWNEAGQEE